MGNAMKRNNAVVDSSPATEEPVVEVAEVEPTESAPVKKVRKYEATDGIRCRSITVGGLYMEGLKSHILYEWSNEGDDTEVEYQDLVAAIRSNSSYVLKPRFIIEDQELVDQFPQVKKVYDSMNSVQDLREIILKNQPEAMRKRIMSLPDGAKESLKHIASQMIANGTLDSVKKIRILDEIYETKLMLMTELFS